MRIKHILLTNFRCFKNESLDLGGYTTFVGKNNVGKSVILLALEKFFNSHPNRNVIAAQDFHVDENGERANDLSIEIEFDILSDEARHHFNHYRVKDSLRLRLSSRRTGSSTSTKFNFYRFVIPNFAPIAEATKAAERLAEYNKLRDSAYPDLPFAKNGTEAVRFMQEYEDARPKECDYLLSSEKAGGSTGPIKDIEKFLQWIYIPAVKDAADESTEGKNALANLMNFVSREATSFSDKTASIIEDAVAKLQIAISENEAHLEKLNSDLNLVFSTITHGSEELLINWRSPEDTIKIPEPHAEASIKSGTHLDRIEFFGHGLQRNYIFSLLSHLASLQRTDGGAKRTLVLGFEEPELYQHPPQARLVQKFLEDLAGRNQIVVTTHSSTFLRPSVFNEIHLVRNSAVGSTCVRTCREKYYETYFRISKLDYEITDAAAESSLITHLSYVGSDLFFANFVVLTEGILDVVTLTEAAIASNKYAKLRELGITILPVNGKTGLPPFIALCECFEIPHLAVFDADYRINGESGVFECPNETLNVELFEHFSLPYPLKQPVTSYSETCTVWAMDMDKAVRESLPKYKERYDEIRDEANLLGKNSQKNIYLTRACIQSLAAEGASIPCIDELLDRIIQAAEKAASLY